jgi:hypothetical protein
VNTHPRVYIDQATQKGRARIEALAAAGDVEKIGFECFPVWTTREHGGDTMADCGDKAAKAHDIDVAYRGVTGAWMVLQAFAFNDECSANPTCAGPPLHRTGPYPTYSQQCEMRDVATPGAVNFLWFGALFMANNNWHGRLGNISHAAVDPRCD